MHTLPTELLLEIFQWATDCYYPHPCSYSYYSPFQALEDRANPNLKIKRSLSMVCRQWRHLTAQFLYKDVWIGHGAEGLKQALKTARSDGGTYADCVERAILPFSSTATDPSNTLTNRASIDIIEACSHLRILVRSQHPTTGGVRFDFEAQTVSFPSLERLEWWHHNEAERSGGVNSLSTVLSSAPNLTYLFIGGLAGRQIARIGVHSVSLPKLTTLRLRVIDGYILHRIVNSWSLPALSHMVIDAPGWSPVRLPLLWQAFGSQLRTVEFGKHVRFLLDDTVSLCVQNCPALEALNFFLFFTTCPKFVEPHSCLRRVGLHAADNSIQTDSGTAWTSLDTHFDVLLGDYLPFLRHIVLHGDWSDAVSDPRFESILQHAQTVGRCIIYPNESSVSHYSN
ncbi:hypothetical protein M378DRAFT_64786 [Amanita muscaria Koide BX008]|uniref:Uncharacterized protein n=1 Tax=Amanita muscaria (strain Koide BX008) TaxID=946122 RepID=A0A0C2TW06_AMAMK|nr:hypothetical protein M378DRAFT_64786 [Amanita muscaria Koide BX008]